MKGIRSVLDEFFAYGCLVAATLYVEEAIFAPLCCLCSFVKNQLTVFMEFYHWLSILFHWSGCLFFHQQHTTLMTVALEYVLKLDSVSPLTLLVFFNIVVALLGPPSLLHPTFLLISVKLLKMCHLYLLLPLFIYSVYTNRKIYSLYMHR